MHKIVHIQPQKDYSIICEFENGMTKVIQILPLIEKHKHIQGVEKLLDMDVFKKVNIGIVGQVYWSGILSNGMDYDLSPEYVYHYGTTVEVMKWFDKNTFAILIMVLERFLSTRLSI